MIYDIPVLYINLNKRKDRFIHINNELRNFKSKTKIEAIYTENNGYEGCVLSHIKALEYSKEKDFDEVIILEDDFSFTDEFIYPDVDFDICLLECLYTKNKRISDNYLRINDAQHTGGYLIKKGFINKLIDNFKESYKKLLLENIRENYLDIYWFKLQKDNIFITPKKTMSIQIEGYSDIKNQTIKRY